MLASLAVTFVAATALSAGCLRVVARLTGVALPVADALFIAALCSGLALLPGYGIVLAVIIASLLILRTTEADPWPDAVLMIVGSTVVWLAVNVLVMLSM
jgi:hypothetical protein